ncbi:hypothetical protein vseg_021288 [Gypsophila vaccaria]
MEEGRRRKRSVVMSKLYTFSCIRPKWKEEEEEAASIVGQRGYERVVHCNAPEEAAALNYRGNYVSTTKYTVFNFVPKSLFEQFRRVANLYFLAVACVSFSPLRPYSAVSIAFPLAVVIAATMAKEAFEDWRRRNQDVEANNRLTEVYDSQNNSFVETRWKKLRVGDIVKVKKDEYFPADLLFLSSNYEDGICYVETSNLDGETNLKLKHALDVTSSLQDERSLSNFKAVTKCEDPNENLYSFIGTLYYNGKQYALSPQQLLLRDSKLRNTDFVYGVVIFTGHDTKVMQNAIDPPSKRSRIETRLDKIIYVLFGTVLVMSFTGSVFFGVMTENDISVDKMTRWYLRPDVTEVYFNPARPVVASFLHLLTDLMLYGYLIPISLYISVEIVKVVQCIFMNQDQEMYYEEADRPAHARTSNLNEDLGQVHTILSDKTGTLTCNSMEFVKCSIAGTSYGRGMTEVEISLAKRQGKPLSSDAPDELGKMSSRGAVKGFNFMDERIMNGRWVKEPHSDMIQMFFRLLAICHTAIPDVHEETGEITYEVESPDEAAFVIAGRELGFEFFRRSQTSISLHEVDHETKNKVDRVYELLHVLEFSSSRKRMSVIVRDEHNKLLLLSKGADSVMFERLSEEGREFQDETMAHVKEYAEAGLRTLILAYRELNGQEYTKWEEEFLKAKTSVSADRDALVEAAAEKIEKDLILLGATAVEDKLQKGVPECIDNLAKAGIKLWVLTGDKMETAINIGYACSLLRQGMKQIVISLDAAEIVALEKQKDGEAVAKASLESVRKQISDGNTQINLAKGASTEFGLIIDGKSLAFALNKNLEKSFFKLASSCDSVICCRSSPKQKALVTRLVKTETGKITLAIGDGANDVGMIQEANIGIGISGVEGMQAAMSSDFSIAQFRFLERLLLLHGHWCYRRISMMICYFFYKNITFGLTLFWFETHSAFSAQPAYNDWYMSTYNVFFTALPVIALGVFDQDVSARLCLKNPFLYQEGVKNILFSWPRILGWMFNGFTSSIIIFFLAAAFLSNQAYRSDGQAADFSVFAVTMYSCVVWAVNCQMALSINYFTWIQHVVIWGSILFWYIFLIIYGHFPPTFSKTAYHVLEEACAPSPKYWFVIFLVVVATLLPYFIFRALQMLFWPMPHDIVQLNAHRRTDGDVTNLLPARVRNESESQAQRLMS